MLSMNGAESLVRTLLESGIDTCFANPGTSEMHFVAALDKVEGMRCILGMAETVVTGCADGYGRMAGKPAATLLHCGPGFANGIANVHNARRAHSPMVNIVGDQATYHRPFDAPLTSDIEGLARAASHWVRTSASSATVGADSAAAVQAANTAPGQIATLILPADTAWNEGGAVAAPLPVPARPAVAPETLRAIAQVLRSKQPAMLVLYGQALSETGLAAANRVAQVTGAKLRTPTQVSRMARGRGRVPVDRIPYVVGASKRLAIPEGELKPQRARGKFEPVAFASTLAALLPENCIVAEDAVTSGRALFAPTFNAAPMDWLQNTGGAIGHAFPCATGAALACPGRKVVCLQADGAGMYSLQALWTQAREKLDVVNVVFANRIYKILYGELVSVGAQPGCASN